MKALDEVPPVARRLESKYVELEESTQDLRPPRKGFEDVRRRKRYVMKIAKPLNDFARAEVSSKHHQVIILHPDEIAGTRHEFHCISKLIIHTAIAIPICRVKVTA